MSDQKTQLDMVEDALSARMEEVTSIAYNIGQDSTFYLNPVAGIKYSGYEMSNTLSRYLVGNRFIEYLAYYRLSEPERIYTNCGELSFHRFWDSYLNSDNYTEEAYLETIKRNTGVRLIPLSSQQQGITFFTYVCPLPQFSTNPQAFVIALLPQREISSLLASPLANNEGEMAVYDAGGNEIYQVSTLAADIPAQATADCPMGAPAYRTIDGNRYVVQTALSDVNSWRYVSVLRMNHLLYSFAENQLFAILGLVVLMIVAVLIILIGIIRKYMPISNLAQTLTETQEGESGGIIDEKSLLSSTIETLKIDSQQKQMLETAYHEAREASKAKSRFLSNMSHDIRTPMNAIIGMTGIALKHADDAASVRECLQKVEVASRYLLDIINNVLDMSRIESGKILLTQEAIDLPTFVHGLITIIHTNIQEKRQRFWVEAVCVRNEKVLGDNVRLTQVCMNILSNAMKFTPEGGTICMRIAQAEPSAPGFGDYTFTFSDTGIGMSPDFVSQVFDAFTRATDSGASRAEGTGLGMAIAKNLVELMGGTIACESAPGEGTTFTVKLRLKLAEGEEGLLARAEKHRNTPVLILDSDGDECARQARLFAEMNLKAVCALALEEALALAAQARQNHAPYGYALINPHAGDPNGTGAAARLAAESPETKRVLVTADLLGMDQAAAKKAGFDRWMPTPLFCSSVLHLLENAQAPQAPAGAAGKPVLKLRGKRVLLVEDNLMNREIARRLIGETGAEIEE